MKLNLFDYEDWRPATDCCIAAAVIGGVATLAGAGVSAYGASKAADAQVQAQQQAIGAQQQMFNTTQQNLQPFIQAGASAIPSLQNWNNTSAGSPLATLLGLTTPGKSQTSLLEQTPGFQFASQYGTMAADNSLAARGLAGPGGSLAKAVSDYNNGLASTQWGNIVSALTGVYNAGESGLQGMVNSGANAAAGLASNATATGQGIANSTTGIGNAQAGAATSIGNSFGGAVSGIGSNLSNLNILSQLSGQGGLFGGGNAGVYAGGANGGTAINPLPGLTSADYGPGASIAAQYGLGA